MQGFSFLAMLQYIHPSPKCSDCPMTNSLRDLPSVDRVLTQKPILKLIETYSHSAVLGLIREQLSNSRTSVVNGHKAPSLSEIVAHVTTHAAYIWQEWPRRVINATGVILHTNLGRAPLSTATTDAVRLSAVGYTDLELGLEDGKRRSRQAYLSSMLRQLTNAEAGIVVNNNAAAMLLGLAAIAAGKKVVVSRGEAVEIGGGFRIPEVLAQSGATLVEVGTTNRTYLKDYESAISEDTAALLKVHTSNFRVLGFTHNPTIQELTSLGQRYNVPVLHDLGSGCLLDTTQFGLTQEPTPQESISAGSDLVFFSGDKLLGGPQAGIIVGRQQLIDRLANHPLARAIRIDKLNLAGLATTLLHYLKDEAVSKVPTWRMIATTSKDLQRRAHRWQKSIGSNATVVMGESTIGAGSLPGETLPTYLISIKPDTSIGSAASLAQKLRTGSPAIICRIDDEHVLLDPRTVLPEEEKLMLESVKQTMSGNF